MKLKIIGILIEDLAHFSDILKPGRLEQLKNDSFDFFGLSLQWRELVRVGKERHRQIMANGMNFCNHEKRDFLVTKIVTKL